jgi:hypothetical protein
MKRTVVMMLMLVVMVMVASAQVITYIEPGVLYLSNGTKVYTSQLPPAHFRLHATIEQCIAETQAEAYANEARKYQVHPNAVYGGGMYGMGMVGMYGGVGFGATGSSFQIGNGHWSFGTSTSNYGGYTQKFKGLKIGSFKIGTTSASYEQPNYTTTTRSAAETQPSSVSVDALKKVTRNSQTRRSNVNNGQTSTKKATTSDTATKTNLWMY